MNIITGQEWPTSLFASKLLKTKQREKKTTYNPSQNWRNCNQRTSAISFKMAGLLVNTSEEEREGGAWLFFFSLATLPIVFYVKWFIPSWQFFLEIKIFNIFSYAAYFDSLVLRWLLEI